MVLRLAILIASVALLAALQAGFPDLSRAIPDWIMPALLILSLLSALHLAYAALRWLRTDYAEDDPS